MSNHVLGVFVMFEKFDWMIGRYQELGEAVSQPEVIADTEH